MADDEMVITSIAPWFGGKRSMASEIVRQLGPHHAYWEPFCGSMAVLMAKPACRAETVNDLHADLINLARVIRDPRLGPALYRRLRRVLCAEPFLWEARAALQASPCPPGPDLDRAESYFIQSWFAMNGTSGTPGGEQGRRGFARRFSSLGGQPGPRIVGAVASIPSWRRRLARVCILSADGIELCEKIEDLDGTVIYADPPYLEKGQPYTHDFAAPDHARLAEALRRFRRTRVVVSYYDDPRLDGLYPGWTKLDRSRSKSMARGAKRDKGNGVRAPEVLLINGPEIVAAGLFA